VFPMSEVPLGKAFAEGNMAAVLVLINRFRARRVINRFRALRDRLRLCTRTYPVPETGLQGAYSLKPQRASRPYASHIRTRHIMGVILLLLFCAGPLRDRTGPSHHGPLLHVISSPLSTP